MSEGTVAAPDPAPDPWARFGWVMWAPWMVFLVFPVMAALDQDGKIGRLVRPKVARDSIFRFIESELLDVLASPAA